MQLKYNRSSESQSHFLELFNFSDDCKVSNASTEIMLDRFCNGIEIEFPFNNN